MAMAAGVASAQSMESVDLDMVARIRQEAFTHSQVMSTLRELTEDVGPRLTASPNMDKANAWARTKLSGWGMSNVHDEAFEKFGRGWDYSHSRVEMVSPHAVPLYAIPKAWTPGTNGPVEGDAVVVSIKSKADMEKYKGKLKGKIAFVSDAREYKPGIEADWQRLDADGLAKLHEFDIPADRSGDNGERMKRFRDRMELVPAINKFMVDEGVLAAVSISSRDNGIIGVSGGGSRMAGEPVGVPDVVMVAE
ncbi:MAG TPA: peptidase, partial [Luteimonas sp.]|nr:peptidase [Luteimonas sp.]